ncbi:hypothetical protein GR183_06010 [Stappia sp. GBMRC 2046]|uniref:Uncharacterized protein n=1 Tax=Stappia sediminis TaxID=2692190 RepID=A0A7X3LSS4_9HYPH|nr:hypothetical protein [Stappia sediminis]MXN64452.1 hypothetical protein [Stappia sediminis]
MTNVILEKISIKGRILPEIREVSIPNIPNIHLEDPNGFQAIYTFNIENGQFIILCEIFRKCENFFQFSIIRCYEFVTTLVDIHAFSNGWALSVIIDTAVHNNMHRRIALSEKSALDKCSAIKNSDDFQKILNITLNNFNLRFAFRDLISSLSTLNYSAIAASRSIEAIRDLISPDTPKLQAWENMRDKLNIERKYLQYITDTSRQPRHGNRGATDGMIQMEVTQRAWRIMDRYLEFMKRGGEDALPRDVFEALAE